MLNASKILLISEDVAFAAELLPEKKPNAFSIQTCAQYISPFIENGSFNQEKIYKLFSKIESDEPYQLILPDQLFFNKIVGVTKDSDAAIKEELKNTILPSLSLSTDTHEVITTVLNEHKGETRIQISALKNTVLAPVRAAASKAGIALDKVVPLSFALKSIISLEPSVSVVQLGETLYISSHYIGVSDCQQVPASETTKAAAIIKEWKQIESSTMTVYALTNELIGSQLSEELKQVIPLQQMADDANEGSKLPAAVTTLIEAVASSLTIPDFPIPFFAPGKASKEEEAELETVLANQPTAAPDNEEDESLVVPEGEDSMPTSSKTAKKADAPSVEETPTKLELEEKDSEAVAVAAAAVTEAGASTEASDLPKPTSVEPTASVSIKTTEVSSSDTPATKPSETADIKPGVVVGAAATTTPAAGVSSTSAVSVSPTSTLGTTQSAVDLSQFAKAQSGSSTEQLKPVQSKDGGKSMMKMILITLGVFIVTVLVGVGVGLLILRFSGQSDTEAPTVTVEPTPMPTPDTATDATDSANATQSATTVTDEDKAAEKVLVVNATTRAGYAGTIRQRLVTGGFTDTTAGNASGEYTETGNFVFIKSGSTAMFSALEDASELTLTEDDSIAAAEDAAGAYSVIIVLNE